MTCRYFNALLKEGLKLKILFKMTHFDRMTSRAGWGLDLIVYQTASINSTFGVESFHVVGTIIL